MEKFACGFLVLPILCLLLYVSDPLLCYLCGRSGRRITDLVCMLYPTIAGLLVFCFSVSIRRLLVGWTKHTWKGRLLITAEILIPVVIALLCVAPIFTSVTSPWPPSGVAFLHGFASRVESRADVPAIREWLKTLSEADYVPSRDYYDPEKLPEPLKGLGPGIVSLSTGNDGNPQVRISAGGGFNHWGATIGLEDMVIHESDLIHYDAWLLLEPGVYVYAW